MLRSKQRWRGKTGVCHRPRPEKPQSPKPPIGREPQQELFENDVYQRELLACVICWSIRRSASHLLTGDYKVGGHPQISGDQNQDAPSQALLVTPPRRDVLRRSEDTCEISVGQ